MLCAVREREVLWPSEHSYNGTVIVARRNEPTDGGREVKFFRQADRATSERGGGALLKRKGRGMFVPVVPGEVGME